jgi:REP element-mobilizing transposase RayT
MENQKTSKKALRSLISESMQEALRSLELPEPSKKVKRLLDRSSKRLADVYAHILKRENKKKKKAEKFMEDAVGKKKQKKVKSEKKRELATA